jgi:hypothetical protein
MSVGLIERLSERSRELKAGGLDWSQAHAIAWLEEWIRQWPTAWGDELQILLYGDFKAPSSKIEIPSLGITVYPEKTQKTFIRGAMTVLTASVTVEEKSVAAVIDAARRINILLGTYTVHGWGNGACGWWSWVTHEPQAASRRTFRLTRPWKLRLKRSSSCSRKSEPR